MKKILCIVGIIGFVCLFEKASAYEITLQSNYKSGIAYLTFYMGKNMGLEDSATVNSKGIAVFKKNKNLPGGIYSIVFPGKRLSSDFLIDKQQIINIKADTTDLINMVVTGSPENNLFQQYQHFTSKIGKQITQERDAYMASNTKADSMKHEAAFIKYNKDLQGYRLNLVAKNPKSLMATLLEAMREPSIPNLNPKSKQDSIDNFNYYKAHFWDGTTFTDDRIIRTPFFIRKLERYYNEIIYQLPPDSVNRDIDYKIVLSRNTPELQKFLLNWFTDNYINPKYMGQDAIFVHLFNKYHSKGLTPWLNEKQMETISRRAYMQMSNLVGAKAANLEMLDRNDKLTYLYDVQADYTVVVFWDPACGHCKEELPKIDSMYRAAWKNKNIKIYAVLTEKNKGEWIKYINEHELNDWTHVYESDDLKKLAEDAGRPGYKQLYDVITTPTVFLLDKDKNILAKKLTYLQINDLLQYKWANPKKQ